MGNFFSCIKNNKNKQNEISKEVDIIFDNELIYVYHKNIDSNSYIALRDERKTVDNFSIKN